MTATRRLTAILAADVAGYSRLMGVDEEGTHERLRGHLRELIEPKIAEHRGRVVKNTEDGFLAEFASVVDAVRCAVEMQWGMAERNAGTPPEKRIEFRVGINLGDVIAEGEDIFGDGVNVAARLEGLAEPGGICISRVVRDQIRDKLPYSFEDWGEQSVKNIARPVRTYRMGVDAVASMPLVTAPAQPAQSPQSALAAITAPLPRLSFVVLPLANLSNDPDQEYFADGITDDLTTDLTRLSGSFVIARNTAFTYKGKPVAAKQIGRELGVRYVIEGSVRRSGEQIRVNVQLIDTETGAHVWADRFDTDRTNLPEAQDEIIGRLGRSLNFELVRDTGRRIEEEKAADPDARDLVMHGWALWWGLRDPANAEKALREFERALMCDPHSIDAKLGIARVLMALVGDGLSKSVQEYQERVGQLLAEVLERDPNRSLAHAVLGVLHRTEGRMAEAQTELEAAVALDRNDAWAVRQLGVTISGSGQPEFAISFLEKAIKLNPREHSVGSTYAALGANHLFLDHTDQAIALLRKARTESPQMWWIRLVLAGALGLKGNIDEARDEIAEALELKPEVNSVARLRAIGPTMGIGDPRFQMLMEKTIYAGLRKAGRVRPTCSAHNCPENATPCFGPSPSRGLSRPFRRGFRRVSVAPELGTTPALRTGSAPGTECPYRGTGVDFLQVIDAAVQWPD
jgi:adenylate cyclase